MATKREIKLYGDLIYQYKPTIRTLIVKILMEKLKKQNRFRKSVNIDNIELKDVIKENKESVPSAVDPHYFALVVGDTVEELIVVNQYISDLLLDEDAQLVPFDYLDTKVSVGDKFIDNSFIVSEVPDVQED